MQFPNFRFSHKPIIRPRFARACRQFAPTVAMSLLTWFAGPTPSAAQSLSKGDGDLRVMTYDANEGTDFLEVQAATNPQQFLAAVGATIAQVRETNPPERMQALAKQILAARPALVSLQELDQWFTGPLVAFSPLTCGTMTLEFDMVQELMDALNAQGGHYQIAIQAQQYAFPPIPGYIQQSGSFLCVAVVNHVAILSRTDLDPSKFSVKNPQSAQYSATLICPSPIGYLPLPRAWDSVDATFHGKQFRFIGTHLESVVPAIREAQGNELREGPANTPLPVIVAMDSNSQAFPRPQDQTYLDFLANGYNGWDWLFPSPSYTCCQAELDNNPVSQLSQRIDLILTRGSVELQNLALFGADTSDRTASGLWPSDHAGVGAQVIVQ